MKETKVVPFFILEGLISYLREGYNIFPPPYKQEGEENFCAEGSRQTLDILKQHIDDYFLYPERYEKLFKK
jgi:hypothetical protein